MNKISNLIKSTVLAILISSIYPLYSAELPHLILYFDINKTLIASDKAGNKTIEDVLNELLSEKYQAVWDNSLKEPVSFDRYVSTTLVPGPNDDQTLRQQRRQYLDHFLDYLRINSHPLYEAAMKDYQDALSILKSSNSTVFPSFYQLINKLEEDHINYSIILRSFGHEIAEVRKEIADVSKLSFAHDGQFQQGSLYLDQGTLFTQTQGIYSSLKHGGHASIRDDWNYWSADGMSSRCGKPFYIDTEDTSTLSIFFDDNIHPTNAQLNIIAPIEVKTGVPIPVTNLIQSGQAVKVDTYEAIVNPQYYIQKVYQALQMSEASTTTIPRNS